MLVTLLLFLIAVTLQGGGLFQIINDDVQVTELNEQGKKALELGNYEEALSYFNEALEIRPKNVHVLNNKGVVLIHLGQYEEANVILDKALAQDPNHVQALNTKGALLFETGNFQEAVSYFEKVIEADPNYEDARNNLELSWLKNGEVLMSIGKHEDAITNFDKVLESKPNNLEALLNKGTSLSSLDKHEEALVYFDKALEIEPDNVLALNNKGVTLKKIGKANEAYPVFRKAVLIDPNYELAQSNLQNLSLQLGYVPIEGTMQIIIHDQHGNLIANIKSSRLEIINHPSVQDTLDNWDFKGITNRNGQQYEKIQNIQTYFPSQESAFSNFGITVQGSDGTYLVFTHYHQVPLELGDELTFIFTIYRPVE